ncbi:hypothetical protein BCA37_30285 [Mycobacterium sp. djl-10]|nr:hypothetical protein BCA37_30285 [Mycobacterium sp. djl-10]
MSYCSEFVTFTIDTDDDTFLQLRRTAVQEVKRAHPRLMAVPVCAKRADGTWIDVWIYESKEAADAANADAENLPEFCKLFAVLKDVQIEITEFPVSAASPL